MVDSKFLARWCRENVDPMQRLSWNKVHLRSGFTEATARTTLEIALFLWSYGYEFACEVKMRNGLRADFIVPELPNSQIIEVFDSETIASIQNKGRLYEELGVCVHFVPAESVAVVTLLKTANGLK